MDAKGYLVEDVQPQVSYNQALQMLDQSVFAYVDVQTVDIHAGAETYN